MTFRLLISYLIIAGVASNVVAQDLSPNLSPEWNHVSIIDPDKDCEIRFLGNEVSITVPASNHNLDPERGLNAPRVLKEVDGDFEFQVKVTADFTPGKKSTKMPKSGTPFVSGGILIWEHERSFLRVERNAYLWKLFGLLPAVDRILA